MTNIEHKQLEQKNLVHGFGAWSLGLTHVLGLNILPGDPVVEEAHYLIVDRGEGPGRKRELKGGMQDNLQVWEDQAW